MNYKFSLKIRNESGEWVEFADKCKLPYRVKESIFPIENTLNVKAVFDNIAPLPPLSMASFEVYDQQNTLKKRLDFVLHTDIVTYLTDSFEHELSFISPLAAAKPGGRRS